MPKLTDKNRLSIVNPELCKEWNYEKNGDLRPEDVCFGSDKKVWWKCNKGHELEETIYARGRHKVSCSYCSGERVCKDNCLLTTHSKLCREWDYEKNKTITPNNITKGCHQKVWWKCNKGHLWEAIIKSRSRGNGCPYCSNQKVCKDNCLATVDPELAKEWDYEKNKLTPQDVTSKSGKKVWWKCKRGHEWQAIIYSRSNGCGCPCCSGYMAHKNDCLAIINPKLAKEFHPTKNGKITISDIKCHSGKKVWWKCKKGHEWKANPDDRSKGGGCPYCSNRRVCNDNCLATINPKLTKEWHPTKNGKLTPHDIMAHSSKKVWWKCYKGHAWEDTVDHRSSGRGCSYCHKVMLKDGNAFASIVEAYYYLKHIKTKYKRVQFDDYIGIGLHRYDFYLSQINTYIEVTSFDTNSTGWAKDNLKQYLKTIKKKKKYVEKTLKAKFKFVQLTLTKAQIIYVRQNSA